MVHRASCWDLRGHPYLDLDLGDLLVASDRAAVDPNWAAFRGVRTLREPSPAALGDPDGVAFPDAAEAEIAVDPRVVPSAGGVDPADAVAYAAVADRVVLRARRGLAYGAAVVVHQGLAVAVDRSCAEGRAVAAGVRGDWVAAVHVVGDPAFAYVHLVRLAVAPEDRVDEVGPVPVPYAVDLEAVPVAVDTGYAETERERGSAMVAPLDSVPGAEASGC